MVRVAGPLDHATSSRVEQVLAAALSEAQLVLLDLTGATFMDSTGVRIITAGARRAERDGQRMIVLEGPPHVQRSLDPIAARGEVHAIGLGHTPEDHASSPHWPESSFEADQGIQPLRNSVNASVHVGRIMAVPDARLWLHTREGAILQAWIPTDGDRKAPTGAAVEVYLDAAGDINGWRAPAFKLAVNQRRLDHEATPTAGSMMMCQGACRIGWLAPAADELETHGEHCLTCDGPLAAR